MTHKTLPFASLCAILTSLATLLAQPASAQTPVAGPLQIGGNATPPMSLQGNSHGLLLGSGSFQWLQSYGGPLILNGNGGGLQAVGIGRFDPNWTLDVACTIRGDSSVSAFNFAAPGVIGKSFVDPGVQGISDNGDGVSGKGGHAGVVANGITYGIVAFAQHGIAGFFRGNVVYTGTLSRSSDARYKTNVQHIGGALQTVEGLRGVSYRYNRDAFPQMNFPAERQVGFIAQEVQSVLPQLVSKDRDGYLSVDYVQVVPVLVEAIKEQQKEIEELKRQGQQMKALEARLTALAAQMAPTRQVARQ